MSASSQAGAAGGFSIIDPLEYPDWDGAVMVNPGATLFHGSAWPRVLHETYGHKGVYICEMAGGSIRSMLPVMEVSSALTGRRGVSLPFIDFCDALAVGNGAVERLLERAKALGRERGWKYYESRGNAAGWSGSTPSQVFYGHKLELMPDTDALFEKMDSAVRRGIRKAQKQGVVVESSGELGAVRTFYRLHCLTRRRHGLPPQPWKFFENIHCHMIQRGMGFVSTAFHEKQPIAASVFLHDARQTMYKYGASDYRHQQLRPNNLVMWEGLRRSASMGMQSLHFGRTDIGHEGLRRFKLGFGAAEERIEYRRYDFRRNGFVTGGAQAEGWFNHVFRRQPVSVLRLAGKLLYPHLS